MVVSKPYGEAVNALHRYDNGINAETRTGHVSSSMQTNRLGKRHTLHIYNVMNSFPGPVASITLKPKRQGKTTIRVLCDPLGAQGSSVGTRQRQAEQAQLKEFVDFLERVEGVNVHTNPLRELRLRL